MDNSIVARRELLLGALERFAAEGNFELFTTAEWVLKRVVGAKSNRTADAQARMAPADAARWNVARNAMFRHVVSHLEISTS